MAPKPGQAGQQMLQLSQLNLQLALARPGALRKYVENQRGAIENLAIEDLLEVAALRGRKFFVENDRVHVRPAAMQGKFISLAFADESTGARRGHFLHPVA